MNTNEIIRKARTLAEDGNLMNACSRLEELCNETELSFYEKNYVLNMISGYRKFHDSFMKTDPGEAFFPVYDQALKLGRPRCIRTSACTEELSKYGFGGSILKAREALKIFLDSYLYDRVKTVFVFSWGFESRTFKLKDPFQRKDISLDIDGRSFEFAAAIALLSEVIRRPVPAGYFFSGSLEISGGEVIIGPAESIEEKLEAAERECPDGVYLLAGESVQAASPDLKKVRTFREAAEIIFPDLKQRLQELQSELGERNITLKIGTVNTADKKKHTHLKFNLKGKLVFNEGRMLHSFLRNISIYASSDRKGVILDGLVTGYSVSTLCAMREVSNCISNFLAVRYTGLDDKVDNRVLKTSAFVIRTSPADHERDEGDVFEYYPDE
jgi:hypothetical protein